MYRNIGTGLLALFGISASSFASLINASFEDPPIAVGTYAGVALPGWNSTPGSQGVFHLPYSGLWAGGAPDGLQIGYAYNTSIAQQSTDVIGVGTTTLSAYGGRRGDGFSSTFTMEMWAGGTASAGIVTGGTLLASVVYDQSLQPLGSFTPISVDYVAGPGNPYLGQLITVRFDKGLDQGHLSIDDVRIAFSGVPEPATPLALGLGAVALMRRRKSV